MSADRVQHARMFAVLASGLMGNTKMVLIGMFKVKTFPAGGMAVVPIVEEAAASGDGRVGVQKLSQAER